MISVYNTADIVSSSTHRVSAPMPVIAGGSFTDDVRRAGTLWGGPNQEKSWYDDTASGVWIQSISLVNRAREVLHLRPLLVFGVVLLTALTGCATVPFDFPKNESQAIPPSATTRPKIVHGRQCGDDCGWTKHRE